MATTQVIEINTRNREALEIDIVGLTPLIIHRWSDKQKKQMRDKQARKSVTREAKDPEQEYEAAKYVLEDGRIGFPADAFKAAAVRGAKSVGLPMTDAKSAFFIQGVYTPRDGRELVPIEGEVRMREDMVRLETGVADIHYRPEVLNWRATLQVDYDPSITSPEQIANMIDKAGYGVGVGEWRPFGKKSTGTFGRFKITEIRQVVAE